MSSSTFHPSPTGDCSDLLYVLVGGAVDVIIRPPNSHSKRRGKKSGITVARLTPTKYFGEYGVFADERRAATIYAVDRVYTWAASKEVVHCQPMTTPTRLWSTPTTLWSTPTTLWSTSSCIPDQHLT